MSADEEFSLVPEEDMGMRLMDIKMEMEKFKGTYEQLMSDQKELSKATDEQKHFAEEFRLRAVKIQKELDEEDQDNVRNLEAHQGRLAALQEEQDFLKNEVEKHQQQLSNMDELMDNVKRETQVPPAMPEKNVVFTGALSNGGESCGFDVKPQILYPMEGGTALITFEEEEVAQNILRLKQHEVHLGECSIKVQAEPVQIMEPSHIEMAVNVCPRRVLVSKLPKEQDENRVVDKLEIHFSKTRHGGGEVEAVEFLRDSGNVVITFVKDDVAKGLTDKHHHEVDFRSGKKHKVQVTPFMNGQITDLKTRVSQSKRTMLLTGIPSIMEQDELQDHLEIHFQKTSNGGGEVDAFVYNPLGSNMLAMFEEDCPSRTL